MMKKIIKKLSLLLASISIFSVFATGCNGCFGTQPSESSSEQSSSSNSSVDSSSIFDSSIDSSIDSSTSSVDSSGSSVDSSVDSSTVEDGTFNPDATKVEKREFNGIHDFTAPDTDRYLIQNGVSDYTIIIPESSTNRSLGVAQKELQFFFKEATGIALPFERDNGRTHTANGKYISIGDTSLFRSSGITLDEEQLGGEGVRIVTKDNTVYIQGGYDYALLYAVYDFLQIYFDYDFYFEDCYSIDRSVRTSGELRLKDFDVTDIPDIKYRSNGYYRMVTGEWAQRLRIAAPHNYRYFPIHSEFGNKQSPSKLMHNTLNWLPPEQYTGSHPKWFSTAGQELCYTARGDAKERDLMLEECANKAIDTMKMYPKTSNPEYDIMLLTLMDVKDRGCTCDACKAEKERYGSMSGSLIKFCNELRLRVGEKMEDLDEEYRRDNLIIGFFAYFYFADAPAQYLEEVQLVDGVVPFLALSETFDYQNDVYSDVNASSRKNIEDWKALSDRILLWTYSTKFTDYYYPIDTFSFYNNNGYEYIASMNPEFFYNQAQITQTGAVSTWHNLKLYLESRIAWNTDLDMQELIDRYMNAMFGKAAPQMHRLYNEMIYRAKIVRQLYWNGTTILSNTTDLNNTKFYPYATVNQWLEICNEAYAALEDLKEIDMESYTKYKRHIDAEWTSPAYIILRLYKNNLSGEEFANLKATFTAVTTDLGMTSIRELGGELSKFIEAL